MTDDELWRKHVEEYPQIKTWSAERQEWARKGFMSGLAEGRKELENENIQLKTRWHIVPEYYLNEAINKFEELEKQINKMKCCSNCRYSGACAKNCNDFDKWELAE